MRCTPLLTWFTLVLLGCSSSSSSAPPLPPEDDACAGPCPQSNVRHLVIIVQENHTFDNHFGRYCTAPAGSSPTCNDGPGCCEAMPATDPSGAAPLTITDDEMGSRDPDHTQACESAEMNGGKMDRYVTDPKCGSPRNVAVSDPAIIKPYWDLASGGALADRYFQPIVGQSSSNDMYLARAQYVFTDNEAEPQGAIGASCSLESGNQKAYSGTTIGDLLTQVGVPWTWFAEGYAAMADAVAKGTCPAPPDGCSLAFYPCLYEPGDVPFAYYASTRDKPDVMKDLAALEDALDHGRLPAVSYVKAIGYKTEHPGVNDKLSDGVTFVTGLVDHVLKSRYRGNTLILLTYDEGGGYFDHVTPPPTSAVDGQPYGTRVPFVAIGAFAKKGFVSHVVMEHSSVVKFIEWNWLGGATGQLQGRDGTVANLGSLLDPAKTGVGVPEQ